MHVTIGTERTGYGRPHFSADFIFGLDETLPEFGEGVAATGARHRSVGRSLLVVAVPGGRFPPTRRDLEPRFRAHSLQRYFREPDRKQHLLGDPYFLDSLLQSGQIMVPREICLPVNIARIDMYDGRFEARSFTAYAYDKVQTETHMQADVAVVKDGRVVMQLERISLPDSLPRRKPSYG